MSSEGPLYPTVAAADTLVGVVDWTNPERITASDDSRATAAVSAGSPSYYLKALAFGFSIPAGATIDGIVVEWERSKSAALDDVSDYRVRIIKGGGIGSTDKSVVGQWPTAEAFQSYGGAADLWGETWTDTDVNGSLFGAAIAAQALASAGTARLDSCRITVHYTVGGGADPAAGVPWQPQVLRPRTQTRVVSYGNVSGVN